MKTIQLTLETAKELFNATEPLFQRIALSAYTKEELTKKELPKTWKELDIVKGYYSGPNSDVHTVTVNITPRDDNRNVFATKEQALASIALAQLSQLMQVYNDGWVPDWKDDAIFKFTIHCSDEKFTKTLFTTTRKFLAFKTGEIRDEFLENFKDLIEQAKPLL